jgi:hypothetical protein
MFINIISCQLKQNTIYKFYIAIQLTRAENSTRGVASQVSCNKITQIETNLINITGVYGDLVHSNPM